jgi:hypothetical protein
VPALVGAGQHHLSGLGLPTTLPEGSQKGRIIVDGIVVIQVFLADQNAGQTLDEVAELSASATTLLVGKRGGDDALDISNLNK